MEQPGTLPVFVSYHYKEKRPKNFISCEMALVMHDDICDFSLTKFLQAPESTFDHLRVTKKLPDPEAYFKVKPEPWRMHLMSLRLPIVNDDIVWV